MFLKTLLWVLFVLFVSVSVRARAGRMATTEDLLLSVCLAAQHMEHKILFIRAERVLYF